MIRILFSIFAFLFSTWAHAGGWISSGGESLIYARNPWFVKNTKSVDYCIQMDESSFSVSKDTVERLITEAFDYWKAEFAANRSAAKEKPGFAKVADQSFRLISECQPSTTLIFKFGLKTLSKDQDNNEVAYLEDPQKYIGVTIRKQYSREQLIGSGTIYITADKGPDAYTNNGHMVSEAWKQPTLLRYALIHELGHLFGIAHVGSGIMSEVFMTVLLNKRMAPEFDRTPQLSFLNPPRTFEVCRGNASFNPDFFGVPKSTNCLRFEASPESAVQWNVFKMDSTQRGYEPIGTVQATSLDQSPYSLKPAVIVQLPPEQDHVFTAVETMLGSFLVGAVFSDTSFAGVFKPQGSVRAVPLQMSLSAEKVSFVGTIQNQQVTVLNYSQLSFLQAIFP